jgi:hypothetical protein
VCRIYNTGTARNFTEIIVILSSFSPLVDWYLVGYKKRERKRKMYLLYGELFKWLSNPRHQMLKYYAVSDQFSQLVDWKKLFSLQQVSKGRYSRKLISSCWFILTSFQELHTACVSRFYFPGNFS